MAEEWIDIKLVVDRLSLDSLSSTEEAGSRLKEALAKGSLQTRASTTIRPSQMADFHSEENRSTEDFNLPSDLWKAVQVNWVDPHPFYKFWYDEVVHLTGLVEVNRSEALDFLRRFNAVSGTADETKVLPEPAETTLTALPKSGRATVHDWAAAAGAAAAYLSDTDERKSAPIVKFIKRWFEEERGKAPDEKDIKGMAREMLKEAERLRKPRG